MSRMIEISGNDGKRLLEIFEKVRAYNDEHYPNKVAKADDALIDKIKKQLSEGVKKKRTFNCYKCDALYDATIIVGRTEFVECPRCGRKNRVSE